MLSFARLLRSVRPYLLIGALWAIAAWASLKFGAVDAADLDLVMMTRVPRLLLATAVGIGLAVSGTTLQALFSNPLCEPYTLGMSSGAALGAVIGISLGSQGAVLGLMPGAFIGAFAIGFVLFIVSFRPGAGGVSLLLSGVMLGFFCSSLVALWMAISDPNGIQGAIFWLMGDLSRAPLEGSVSALAGVLALTLAIWSRWRELDAFLLGEEDALALGVDVPSARRRLLVLASILVGICVSSAGMIGFIGLVVPHLARRVAGALHLRAIPACAALGALTLTAADLLARTVHRPYELPAGVITALAGAPVFVWIMLKRGGE